MRSDAEQIIGPHVHHQKLSVLGEPKPYSPGGIRSRDVQFHFRDQKSLILCLHIGGIARRIHQAGQDQFALLTLNPAEFRSCTEADCPRKKLSGRERLS